ncbi:uncharacterized protein PAC_09322 [Phialocephala subalpina]|uniref:Uncharacterized protein n=1 Tax=Phialocephala subalpina TaxID=576137 RepID=A0A1L7X316_9HELO|nr:uncharacterized protein PAC_09322 [Phialocephala subalpina]
MSVLDMAFVPSILLVRIGMFVWHGLPYVSSIEDGYLVLEGPVKKVKLDVPPEAQEYNPPYLNIDDEVSGFDEHPIPWQYAGQLDHESADKFQHRTFFCLLVKSVIHQDDRPKRVTENFLMLEPVEGESGSYRRVGMGRMRGRQKRFVGVENMRLRLV